MIRACFYGAAALVMLTSTAASAGTPKNGSDEPELVVDGVEWECRRIQEVGSRLGKKTCASPEQWAAHDKAEAERTAETNALRRERGTSTPPAPGM
jgi:hypothetical protein